MLSRCKSKRTNSVHLLPRVDQGCTGKWNLEEVEEEEEEEEAEEKKKKKKCRYQISESGWLDEHQPYHVLQPYKACLCAVAWLWLYSGGG